jgi:hypothetical protein
MSLYRYLSIVSICMREMDKELCPGGLDRTPVHTRHVSDMIDRSQVMSCPARPTEFQ